MNQRRKRKMKMKEKEWINHLIHAYKDMIKECERRVKQIEKGAQDENP